MKKCFLFAAVLCLQNIHSMNNNNNNNNKSGYGSPRVISNDIQKSKGFEKAHSTISAPSNDSYEHFDAFYTENPQLLKPLDTRNNTALHVAVTNFKNNESRIYMVIATLLANGADPEATNTDNQSALSLAKELNNPMLLQLLKKKKHTKETLITLAYKNQKKELLAILTQPRKFQ